MTNTTAVKPALSHEKIFTPWNDDRSRVRYTPVPAHPGLLVKCEVSHNKYEKRMEAVVEVVSRSENGTVLASYRMFQANPHRGYVAVVPTARFSAKRFAGFAADVFADPSTDSIISGLIDWCDDENNRNLILH